jgi:hypothetical protein
LRDIGEEQSIAGPRRRCGRIDHARLAADHRNLDGAYRLAVAPAQERGNTCNESERRNLDHERHPSGFSRNGKFSKRLDKAAALF